jgi:hypothetical protein
MWFGRAGFEKKKLLYLIRYPQCSRWAFTKQARESITCPRCQRPEGVYFAAEILLHYLVLSNEKEPFHDHIDDYFKMWVDCSSPIIEDKLTEFEMATTAIDS